MIGVALFGFGALLLWAAFTGRGDAVLNALQINLPAAGLPVTSLQGQASPTTKAQSDGSSGGGASSTVQPDSGSHMGFDLATGLTFAINKPYASMTDAEKDAANAYAVTIGNIGQATELLAGSSANA